MSLQGSGGHPPWRGTRPTRGPRRGARPAAGSAPWDGEAWARPPRPLALGQSHGPANGATPAAGNRRAAVSTPLAGGPSRRHPPTRRSVVVPRSRRVSRCQSRRLKCTNHILREAWRGGGEGRGRPPQRGRRPRRRRAFALSHASAQRGGLTRRRPLGSRRQCRVACACLAFGTFSYLNTGCHISAAAVRCTPVCQSTPRPPSTTGGCRG